MTSLFNIPFCKLCERQMENKSVTRNKLLLTDIPSPSSFSILPFILQSLLTCCSVAAPWIFTMNNITHCPSPNNACHIPWDIYCIFYNKEKYSSLFFLKHFFLGKNLLKNFRSINLHYTDTGSWLFCQPFPLSLTTYWMCLVSYQIQVH